MSNSFVTFSPDYISSLAAFATWKGGGGEGNVGDVAVILTCDNTRLSTKNLVGLTSIQNSSFEYGPMSAKISLPRTTYSVRFVTTRRQSTPLQLNRTTMLWRAAEVAIT